MRLIAVPPGKSVLRIVRPASATARGDEDSSDSDDGVGATSWMFGATVPATLTMKPTGAVVLPPVTEYQDAAYPPATVISLSCANTASGRSTLRRTSRSSTFAIRVGCSSPRRSPTWRICASSR